MEITTQKNENATIRMEKESCEVVLFRVCIPASI